MADDVDRRLQYRRAADRYHRRQVWDAVEDLSLLEVSPRERKLFPAIWHHLVVEHESRLRWSRRGAWLAGLGATLGASVGPDVWHALWHWVSSL